MMMEEKEKETMLEYTYGAEEIRWSSGEKMKAHQITIEYQRSRPHKYFMMIHKHLKGGYEEQSIFIMNLKYWIHLLLKTKN